MDGDDEVPIVLDNFIDLECNFSRETNWIDIQDVEDHAEGPAVNLQGVGAVLSWSPPQGRCTAGSQSTS